jgi:NAD(P)H-nitrite reductase large subunit
VVPPHYVIVGSGIAGLSAAETLRQRIPRARLTLVSEEAHPFYSRPGLAYLLRGDVPEKQLHVRTTEDLRGLALERITARVEQLAWATHELVLADGTRLRYDRLLLATGALAVAAPFPGGDLAGIVKLDSLDDARRIMKLAHRRKAAVVVGGGITALELVEGLRARGMRVHYLLRGSRYWSDVLDEAESNIILDRLRHEGVIVHLQTQVTQALGTRGQLTGVETLAGEVIPCHVLAVAIGVRPRTDLARRAGLHVERGIVVNDSLQTSVPDVFAAGDVAEVHDTRTGATALDVLWSTALAQGQAAGASMAGARSSYTREIPLNVTQLAGLTVTIIGAVGGGKNDDLVAITRGESEVWRATPQAQVLSGGRELNRVRLLVGERYIVGALVMGEQTWSRPLQRLVAARADITPIRAALLGDAAGGMMQLANFFKEWEQTNRR